MSKQKIKVALVGQPNVGKSHLINSISGAQLHVGNFSGVTVEKKEVVFEVGEHEITIVDLPGTYSLNAYSPDEEVAKDFLLNEQYDLIVNVLDANAIQRNLAFSLSLMDMGKKIILAINMIDEVTKNGGEIDNEEMSRELGVPVILVSAKQKLGVDRLVQKIIEMYEFGTVSKKLVYDNHIEAALEAPIEVLEKDPELTENARFITLRLLENDKNIYKQVHDRPIFLDFHEVFNRSCENLKILSNEDSTAEAIVNSRISLSKGIFSKSVKIKHQDTISEKVDNILIHQLLGLPIFLVLMWIMFQLTFKVGALPQGYITQTFTNIAILSKSILPPNVISEAFYDGALPAVGAILGFLPNILILFFAINLLEQTGYMARVAFLLDGIMKRFGLHGKAFIPLMTGFGCSVPAYMAARTLKNPKDKLITMLIIGFFSCSARMPVYILMIGAFFTPEQAGNMLFAIYIGGVVLAILAAKMLRSTILKGNAEPFVMEMPRYRWPSFKAILRELKLKTVMFLKNASVFIAIVSMAIWFLSAYPNDQKLDLEYANRMQTAQSAEQNKTLSLELAAKKMENSYIGFFGKMIEPVFEPLGFDWKLSVTTVTALAAKEVAVASLATLYGAESSEENSSFLIKAIHSHVDFKSAVAFIIIIMVYSPCIAAMSTFFAEVREWKWRAFYIVYPNILAFILAFVAYKLLSLFGF